MSEKVRVPSIQCPRCGFNNPEATICCFDCGDDLGSTPNRLVTVRRHRHSATAISIHDLVAVRARVRPLTNDLRSPLDGPTTDRAGRRVLQATRRLGPPRK